MLNVDRRAVYGVAAVVLAATLGACGSSGSGSGTGAAAQHSSAPTSATGSSASPSAADSQAAKGNGAFTCPSASAISSATGQTVGAPQVTNQSGTTMCSYPDASGGILAVSDEADAGFSGDAVKSALSGQAQALGGGADSVTPVSGLGDAAFEFTQSGLTTLGIVSGSAYLAVIGAPSPAAALAVAKLVI
jgi:hypothetical protein